MSPSDSKLQPLARQWRIVKLLSAANGLSLDELAIELGVSIKSIRRDLKELREADIPFAESTGPHGKKTWRLDMGQRVPTTFNFDEIAALYFGRLFFERLAGTSLWASANSAFRKIEQSLGNAGLAYLDQLTPLFHQTAVGVTDYSSRADKIDVLRTACEDLRVVTADYQPVGAAEPRQYTLQSYGITEHEGSLYAAVTSSEWEGVRNFKVDRFHNVELQSEHFERSADFDLKEHLAYSFGIYHQDGDPFLVRVRFAPEAARYVSEKVWHVSQTLELQDDGSVILNVELSSTRSFMSWVLGFRSAATVLEPASFVEEIRSEIEKMSGNYLTN
ncbi:MAG: WYL domain-containing protein [Planctomycetota bacterium]|nr:WYL domain-containing protein [Planctomycetota bacterium]